MKQTLSNHPIAMSVYLVLGLILGAVLWSFLPQLGPKLESILDPVVVMDGELVSLDEKSARVHLWGEKRKLCDYGGMSAYAIGANGVSHDAMLARDDLPVDGTTKPPGTYDLGVWKVENIGAAIRVEVWVTHFCDGRRRVSQIADVSLVGNR